MTIRQIDPTNLVPGVCRTHPSITMCRGTRYMSYRHEIEPINKHSQTLITECDENWNPVSSSQRIGRYHLKNQWGDEVFEDTRLYPDELNGEIYYYGTNRQCMGIGAIDRCFGHLRFDWETETPGEIQKNWTATGVGSNRVNFIYWPTRLSPRDKMCPDSWEYGDPHGGTPIIPYGNMMVGFFHSWIPAPDKDLPKNHPSDVAIARHPRRTYFGSPYAWCGDALLFPTEPLIWPRLYASDRRAPNNHDVVFPCGIVREGEKWLVSYGDDIDCWLAEFSTEEIFKVLKPFKQ